MKPKKIMTLIEPILEVLSTTQVRIKVEWGYCSGTYNAPQDGYLMGSPKWDGIREYAEPLDFASVREAYEFLIRSDAWHQDSMYCQYDGDGQFSVGGQYVCAHGQHSRPVYTIVGRKSGRCTKAIIAELDQAAYYTAHNGSGRPEYKVLSTAKLPAYLANQV